MVHVSLYLKLYILENYVCLSCKRAIYKNKEKVSPVDIQVNKNDLQKMEIDSEHEEDNIDKDVSFVLPVDKKAKEKQINDILQLCGAPPIKIKRAKLSMTEKKLVNNAVTNLSKNYCEMKEKPSANFNEEVFINDVKTALAKATSKYDKFQILTSVPVEWSIRKMRAEFNISRCMASKAKKMRKTEKIASRPIPKKGRRLPERTVKKVRDFYLADESSRMLPGMNDCVSIKVW